MKKVTFLMQLHHLDWKNGPLDYWFFILRKVCLLPENSLLWLVCHISILHIQNISIEIGRYFIVEFVFPGNQEILMLEQAFQT